MSDTLGIKAYGVLTRILAPFLPLYLRRRAKAGKENPDRLSERFGQASLPRPSGNLIWMHGASVGETTMLLPLIDCVLEDPNTHVLVTSGTVTSADLMAKRLPDRAVHQFVPVDTPGAVTKFLGHWKPDLALWAESEIWPNLIRLTNRRNIPLALVNARMSTSSINRWKKYGLKNARSVFGNFDKILAADSHTADGLEGILGGYIQVYGNLKDDAPPLPVDESDLKRLQSQIGDRPVWCAASTHAGEEEIILQAHQDILAQHPDTLLILVPRHPDRTQDVLKLTRRQWLNSRLRSEDMAIEGRNTVFHTDTIGDMGLAYRLSDISFIGGSLIENLSGHNPLEAAQLNNCVLNGPYVSSFTDTYREMQAAGASQTIGTATVIGARITELFSNRLMLARQKQLAKDFADNRDKVLDKVWEQLKPLMPKAKS